MIKYRDMRPMLPVGIQVKIGTQYPLLIIIGDVNWAALWIKLQSPTLRCPVLIGVKR